MKDPEDKPGGPDLTIVREFAHPPEAVYRAWTEEQALRQWMGPEGLKTPDATMDARVGGSFTWCMTEDDGSRHIARGEVVEMVPNRRLRFSWYWDKETGGSGQVMDMTLEFEPTPEGTRMTLHQTNFIHNKARDDHRDGWTSSFNKLQAYLES